MSRLRIVRPELVMAEHLQILRRVGWALVIIGVLDIGFMVYCIVNRMNYSSSLNVFAVGAGVFLLSALIVFPWMWPLDYWLLTLRQEPLGFVFSILLLVAMLLALFWVYRTLRAPPVLAARAAAGQSTDVPKSAFVSGCVLAIGLAVLLQFTLKGETAEKAVRLATEQYGADYTYVISSIHWSGGHVSARLTAFNPKESREVEIEWED